ncbi:hypothetical protein NKG05_04770 [Oerskovia sp. M15]
MTTASEYVEAIRTQQRAVRHATSLPLLVNALAMAYLTYLEAAIFGMHSAQILVPATTYGVLLVVMLVQRQLIGVGVGNDRYGVLALALLALVFVPFGFVAVYFVGPVFFLGWGSACSAGVRTLRGCGVLGWCSWPSARWSRSARSPTMRPSWEGRRRDGHLHDRAPGPRRRGLRP